MSTSIVNTESRLSGYFLQELSCDRNTFPVFRRTVLERKTYCQVRSSVALSYFVTLSYENPINQQTCHTLIGLLVKTHKLAQVFDSYCEVVRIVFISF